MQSRFRYKGLHSSTMITSASLKCLMCGPLCYCHLIIRSNTFQSTSSECTVLGGFVAFAFASSTDLPTTEESALIFSSSNSFERQATQTSLDRQSCHQGANGHYPTPSTERENTNQAVAVTQDTRSHSLDHHSLIDRYFN
jgi:hypothetical protein